MLLNFLNRNEVHLYFCLDAKVAKNQGCGGFLTRRRTPNPKLHKLAPKDGALRLAFRLIGIFGHVELRRVLIQYGVFNGFVVRLC